MTCTCENKFIQLYALASELRILQKRSQPNSSFVIEAQKKEKELDKILVDLKPVIDKHATSCTN